MNEAQGYELVLDTLAILRKLFRGSKNYQSYQANHQVILNLIIKALSNDYSKVVAEGLRVAGQFVHVLRANGQSTIAPALSQIIQPLFEAVKDKLVKTDIDQEVKQASIVGMANLITVCHKGLS